MMSTDKNAEFANKQIRFQNEYEKQRKLGQYDSEDDGQEDDEFVKQMRVQENIIFGGNNQQKGVQFENDQIIENDSNINTLYVPKQVEKKLINNKMIAENPQNTLPDRSSKQIDGLIKQGKKHAAKDSVIHKNQQKYNIQVDDQLKKQNVVQKKGAIKSGFDVIATTNQLLKKQYEESIKLEEYDHQFNKMEMKFIEMIDGLKFNNKKKEIQYNSMLEQLESQKSKVNGDNYWQSQLANVSVNANNSNMLHTSSYYSNKFVTTLNQHSVLGCRATSTFTLKDNEENQQMIQNRIEELKNELDEINKKQFAEETAKETMEYKIKEVQATKVVLQKEISNQNVILKNYDIQLNELSQKLEEYEKIEQSYSNQNQTMVKFLAADENQRKQFLNKRKGNYEMNKVEIKNALQDHNQIQEQITKSTMLLEKMKLQIEELDYQAKNKRQMTQQSREILSILENFDLLCDVFIYNDPASSNVMEIDSAYELTNKKKVVEFQEPNHNSNNHSTKINKKKMNSHSNSINHNHNQNDQQQNLSQPNQQLSPQKILSNFNSKDNSPSVRNKTKTNDENVEQSKSKFAEAAAAAIATTNQSSNISFSAAANKEIHENDQQHKSKEGSSGQIEDDQNTEGQEQNEEEIKIDYKYKQGDIILRLAQFYGFHKNDLEFAVNQVIQTFKSYNNDHDTLKTRIVDLSVQKKNLTQLYKKLENELWEFILVFGDIKKQEEEEELQKKINRRLNKQNTTDLIEDQDEASKNLLKTNHKKNNFNEQNTELDLAYNAQIFEGQCFLFLNESLFRLSKTVNSIKYIICYSELFKEDMDVQNYYFKNDLFKEISPILKFSLQTKMVYQESDAPFIEQKVDSQNLNNSESHRQSEMGDNLIKNQVIMRDQPLEKSNHTQATLAKSIIKKYLKSSINKLQEIKNIFIEQFCPQVLKHDKLDTLIETIRNDVVIMYFCSIETFTKFAGDIKERFMKQYDIESVKEEKQIDNLYLFTIDHLNQLRDYGENLFRINLRRLIGFYEYILLHTYLQSDKVWYDIKAYDPKFYLPEPQKNEELKRRAKRTWREKLVLNKIKEYENYLGGDQDIIESSGQGGQNNNSNNQSKEQILTFLNMDEQQKNDESEKDEINYFEEKRENLKYPKVNQKIEVKRKAYSFVGEDEINNITLTSTSNTLNNHNNNNNNNNNNSNINNNDNNKMKQKTSEYSKLIVRMDKDKMQQELQRCIGIKKNFQRRIQETDLSALSRSTTINNSTTFSISNQPSFKLNSSSMIKTEEIKSIHNMDYPFSRVFFESKPYNSRFTQSTITKQINQRNSSLNQNKQQSQQQNDMNEKLEKTKFQKRALSTEYNNSKPEILPIPQERQIKTAAMENKKFEQKKQQSLPIIKNNNQIISGSSRSKSRNNLPHQRHVMNPSAQSIRYDPNQSRITNSRSEGIFTKKNSSNAIQTYDIHAMSSASQFQQNNNHNKNSYLDSIPIEDLLNKQLYNIDNEINHIPSGILSGDFNRNKSIFPSIPGGGFTDYSSFSHKSSAIL